MKRLALTMMCVLSVCAGRASFATAAEPASNPASNPASKPAAPEPEVRRFELTAVAPPTPAMKYALMFTFAERIPGNAAMPYLDAGLLLEPNSNDTAQRALDALDANDEQGFAKLADSIDLLSMFDQLDVAGRRDHCDWDSPLRERGVLTLLPHLKPLTHGVAKVIRVRATRQVMQGKVDEALRTLRLGYELADKIGRESVIVSAMVSVGQFSWMNEPLARLMSRPESPNLYWTLREMPQRFPILRHAWDAEFGWMYVCVPTLAKARAGERLSAAQWHKAMYDEVAPFFLDYENYRAMGTRPHPDPVKDAGADVLRQAREQFAASHKLSAEQVNGEDSAVVLGEFYYRTFETAHDELGKLRGLSYPEILPRSRANVELIEKLKKQQSANPFLQGVDGMYRAIERFARADRQLAALSAVEAIRSYAAANGGKLPSKLDDVTDTPVPLNPITGKAFEYEVKGAEATLKDSASETPLTYTISIRK
jgi:hypothetical protein